MTSDLVSRPFHPQRCCEACVFGRGEHAAWCERRPERKPEVTYDYNDNPLTEPGPWTMDEMGR